MARKQTKAPSKKAAGRRTRPQAAEGHLERERKYEGDATAALPDFDPDLAPDLAPDLDGAAPLPGVATAVAAATERLRAVYYDTADHRLLARRITLRHRSGGHDAGWHLKLPAADGARLELRLPSEPAPPEPTAPEPDAPTSAPPDPARIPAELLARVRAYTREAPLAPVALLATERRRTLLTAADGGTLVELAQDAVTARALEPSGTVRYEQSWHEVEAELVDGEGPLLDAVERRLLAAGLRPSASASKLARALGPVDVAEPPARDEARAEAAPGSIGALLGALLRRQVGQLLAQDAEVRRDTPDAVHQMRVCARRLRSTLRVHERLLRLDEVAGLEEELRWLGRTLGSARDREVLGERLLRDLDALDPAERPGPMRRRLGNWSRSGYRQAWRNTLRELEGARYFALLDALDVLAAHPPLRARADRPVATEVRRLLTRERRRACGRVAAALALTPGTERDEAMHAARRAAKRARYAGEGAGQPRFAAAMKGLQTVLGERQDAVMAAQVLPELAAAAHHAGEPGFGYGVLYVRQRDAILAAEADVPERQALASAVRVT